VIRIMLADEEGQAADHDEIACGFQEYEPARIDLLCGLDKNTTSLQPSIS